MTRNRLSGIVAVISLVALVITANASQASDKHKVKSGDTLWVIAKKNHTTVKALAHANGISEKKTLALGSSIVIPGKQSKKQIVAKRSYKRTTRISKANKSAKYVQMASLPVSTEKKGLISTALACRGTRYASGGTSRGGFDCSGFTRYVFAKYGKSLPHSSAAQARIGKAVSKSELKSGDLVFFHTYKGGISHVGIYIGGGKFVHAANHGRGVTTDYLNSSYYASRYRGSRRVN